MYEHGCIYFRRRKSSRKVEAGEITFYAYAFPYRRGVDKGVKQRGYGRG